MISQATVFYEYPVAAVRFVDWVTAMVIGEAVGAINWVNEAVGCDQASPTN
ncbi:MAG: hypothetical protein IIC60_00015 [Proteobacteria bacterium]|nr:hypothetical protein [Pseudomonadota bacterium]